MNLTLKNVPKKVHQNLKKRAQTHHRSLNGEALSILESVTSDVHPDLDSIIAGMEALNRRQKRPVNYEEIRAGIEEGRE